MVALGSAALFGLSTPLAKILVGTVSPLLLAGLLYAGSGLGLSLVLVGRRLWTPRESSISLPRRGEWLWLAGAIFFGGVAGPAALMYGLVSSAASTASLLLNLEAVFTALLAWFLFRENFDRRIMLGMFTIVGGRVRRLRCQPRDVCACAPSSWNGAHRSVFFRGPVLRRCIRGPAARRYRNVSAHRRGTADGRRRLAASHRAAWASALTRATGTCAHPLA